MRAILFGAVLALAASAASAGPGAHAVRGYVTKNGTYVAPHMATNPNGTRADNYSTVGNVNPYTGEAGTKPLYPNAPATAAPTYSAPATATAVCADGSYSYAQNRAGSCSSHGGVAAWR